jgi:hypothetical protein
MPAALSSLLRHAQVCAALQALVGLDVGGRGIGPLVRPPQHLALASLAFLRSPCTLLLAGFPCNASSPNPGETDGMSGAVALAAAALALGQRVALATDASQAATLEGLLRSRGAGACSVHAFPPKADAGWAQGGLQWQRREALAREFAHTVAIERPGQAADGCHYSMRQLPLCALVAPLDALLTWQPPGGAQRRLSTAIGDGGNEAGMGSVLQEARQHVPRGAVIASVTPCDHLVVAGVSNWGGWALVAAVQAAARLGLGGAAPAQPLSLLPSVQQELQLASALEAAGVRDGLTGQLSPPGSVDGMQAEVHLGVLQQIRGMVDTL